METVDGREEKRATGSLYNLVFGQVPSQLEIENAIHALQNFMLGKSSSGSELKWLEQKLDCFDPRLLLSQGYRRLCDAFQMLQTDPIVKVNSSSDFSAAFSCCPGLLHCEINFLLKRQGQLHVGSVYGGKDSLRLEGDVGLTVNPLPAFCISARSPSPSGIGLGIPDEAISSFSLPLMDWMKVNCNSNAASQYHSPWQILFPFGVWAIWLHKNKLVFNPHLFSTQDKVVDTYVAKAYEFFVVSGTSSLPRPFHFMLVSWHILPPGWVKLSTDDFSLGNLGLARVSGLIRDHSGSWICGFA
ncbi:hypothetical protein CMV_019894 [Castanea mollissima]|uniref:Uncharacterized protein n=1 Tax=Castanea mollissima TaxID=60419 RepID=A0A8J4QMD8_9ROSI|nr:hypothetical protein CMV_019894 [Castanea mollissima]